MKPNSSHSLVNSAVEEVSLHSEMKRRSTCHLQHVLYHLIDGGDVVQAPAPPSSSPTSGCFSGESELL